MKSSKNKEKLKSKITKLKQKSKRAINYQPLLDGHGSSNHAKKPYSGPAYETYSQINWNKAWDDWQSLKEDGTYKYRNARELAKELARGISSKDSDKRAKYIMTVIGPQSVSNSDLVPWLGDWEYARACRFIGETEKESLLFGNPRIHAVRETVKQNFDALKVAKSIGTNVTLTWLANFEAAATKCDAYWQSKLWNPKYSTKKNHQYFKLWAEQKSFLFSRVIDSCNEILKCFGVGKDDIALLTQMMIASMKDTLGQQTANVMIAASTGMRLDGNQLTLSDGGSTSGNNGLPENAWEANPTLRLMMSTFFTKNVMFGMEHPGIEIPGVPKEDTRTDPRKDPIKDIDGKANGGAISKKPN